MHLAMPIKPELNIPFPKIAALAGDHRLPAMEYGIYNVILIDLD